MPPHERQPDQWLRNLHQTLRVAAPVRDLRRSLSHPASCPGRYTWHWGIATVIYVAVGLGVFGTLTVALQARLVAVTLADLAGEALGNHAAPTQQ